MGAHQTQDHKPLKWEETEKMFWKPKFGDLTNIGSQKEMKSNDGNQSETLSDIDYIRIDALRHSFKISLQEVPVGNGVLSSLFVNCSPSV